MDDMEEKLNSILSNPQMMSQIMSLAQSLGKSQNTEQKPELQNNKTAPTAPQPNSLPLPGGFDPGMIQKIAGIAQQSGIDRNQQTLLKALGPYLCKDRIVKLEKAMRAAKLASVATAFLGSGNSPFSFGR